MILESDYSHYTIYTIHEYVINKNLKAKIWKHVFNS